MNASVLIGRLLYDRVHDHQLANTYISLLYSHSNIIIICVEFYIAI